MDDPYSYTVKLKRGDGLDTQKVKITAPDVETLEQRVEAVRERLEMWADGYREIRPYEQRQLPDNQGTLPKVGES